MGDRGTLAKAKKELEDLYLGVPDESVNLTFQDFAQVRNQAKANASSTMDPILEKSPMPSPLAKLPSLDFSKGFPSHHNQHHHDDHYDHHQGGNHDDQRSVVYEDTSVAYGAERGGRRRPGIPHSNICAVCCNYIYICRHRCLVCGRVYCRRCVSDGMGEMTEGRKCIDCLGRRFSHRYIHKAGNTGWCMGYPSAVKQQELKWAERGARRSGDNRYGNSVLASRSRSPVAFNSVDVASRSRSPVAVGLATPSRHQHQHSSHTSPPSFVMNSPYSPTSHHPMPF